LKVLGCNCFK